MNKRFNKSLLMAMVFVVGVGQPVVMKGEESAEECKVVAKLKQDDKKSRIAGATEGLLSKNVYPLERDRINDVVYSLMYSAYGINHGDKLFWSFIKDPKHKELIEQADLKAKWAVADKVLKVSAYNKETLSKLIRSWQVAPEPARERYSKGGPEDTIKMDLMEQYLVDCHRILAEKQPLDLRHLINEARLDFLDRVIESKTFKNFMQANGKCTYAYNELEIP